MDYRYKPWSLTWTDVNPSRHPFDVRTAPAAVNKLAPASTVPHRPAVRAGDRRGVNWSHKDGDAWAAAMTKALIKRFGLWSSGWRWAKDEGDFGGGPVGSWCCPMHSITGQEETLERVANALVEWRGWLEELAETFNRYPLTDLKGVDQIRAWERGSVHLIHQVVDRTGAGDVWYGHCAQVLTWFLVRWKVPKTRADRLVEQAIGGRFGSWTEPDEAVVEAVAEELARSVGEFRAGG